MANVSNQSLPRSAVWASDPVAVKIAQEQVTAIAATSTSVAALDGVASAIVDTGVGGNEMQALVVLGLAGCSRPGLQKITSRSKQAVVPLQLGQGALSGLYGALLLIGIPFTLHAVATVCWAAIRGLPSFSAAAEQLRFPSLSLQLMMLLYQGLTFEASVVCFSGKASAGSSSDDAVADPVAEVWERVVAGAVLLLTIVVPAVGAWWVKCRCDAAYLPFRLVYVSASEVASRSAISSDGNAVASSTSSKSILNSGPMTSLILPAGYWALSPLKKMFGFFFGSFPGQLNERYWMFLVPFAQALIVGLVAGLFGSRACGIQSGILATVFWCVALLLVDGQPYRVRYIPQQ